MKFILTSYCWQQEHEAAGETAGGRVGEKGFMRMAYRVLSSYPRISVNPVVVQFSAGLQCTAEP